MEGGEAERTEGKVRKRMESACILYIHEVTVT